MKLLFKDEDGPGKGRALDCGAGIGRITKHLLSKFFQTVDLGKKQVAIVVFYDGCIIAIEVF